MDAKDLIVKTRVARIPDKYSPYQKHLIVGHVMELPEEDPLTKQLKCYVKWDETRTWMHSNPEEIEISKLMPEADGKELWSQLEADYQKAEDQIKEKMKIATQALREAIEIANGVKGSPHDFYEVSSEFTHVVEEAGWLVDN